jgi:hypothetical protein
MLGTCVLALIVEVHVYRNVTDDSADYKVKMLTQQIEAAKADWEGMESLLAEAEEKAWVAEGHKNAPGDAGKKLGGKITDFLANGMDPDEVGRIALDGIVHGKFWIFTHPKLLKLYHEQIEMMDPDGMLSMGRLT